jgi:CheY-like chemotaxis protein
MVQTNKVLAVDDNPVNLAIVEEILADEFEVLRAETGHEALRLAAQFHPSFVLLDVMMPGMSGLEVCRQLRTLAGLRDAVIIMISAKAMPAEKAEGIQSGADAYITKPFDETELLSMMRRFSGASGAALDH